MVKFLPNTYATMPDQAMIIHVGTMTRTGEGPYSYDMRNWTFGPCKLSIGRLYGQMEIKICGYTFEELYEIAQSIYN